VYCLSVVLRIFSDWLPLSACSARAAVCSHCHVLQEAHEDIRSFVVEIEPLWRLNCRKWSQSHGKELPTPHAIEEAQPPWLSIIAKARVHWMSVICVTGCAHLCALIGLTVGLDALPKLGIHVCKAFRTPAVSVEVSLSSREGSGRWCNVSCEWRFGTGHHGELRTGTTSSWGFPGSTRNCHDGTGLDGEPRVLLSGWAPHVGVKQRWQPRKGCCVSASFKASPNLMGLEDHRNTNCSIFTAPQLLRGAAARSAGTVARDRKWGLPTMQSPACCIGFSVSLLGDRFGRSIEALDIIGAKTQKWQLRGGTPTRRQQKSDCRDRLIGVVAGHWIDPGEDTGAPGEREFNMVVADALHKQVGCAFRLSVPLPGCDRRR